MLRKTFESELQQVKDDVLVLGSMVEQAILISVEAMKKRDIKLRRRSRAGSRDQQEAF
jgi:phosphate transport system protein